MQHEVTVVGAGVVGMVAALCMQQRGYNITLLDQGPLPPARQSQRVYALNHASLALLEQVDVLKTLPADAFTPYHRMHVWVANREAKIDFDARLHGQSNLGAILLESALLEGLYQTCVKNDIFMLSHTRMERVKNDPSQLTLIANGVDAPLRKQLHVSMTQRSYQQEALVTTVSTENPHQHACYQIFTPEGPLAFLPLHDPHQASIVWSTSPHYNAHLRSLNETSFNQILTQTFEHRLGETHRLTSLQHFPLTMRHLKQYVGGQWLFLGDAAHTIHPMAGLGLNVGLADVACWLKHFDHYGHGRLSRALQAYQRERKTEVWKIILMLDGLKFLFSDPGRPVQFLRDLGLTACDAMPMLKRFLMEQAQRT